MTLGRKIRNRREELRMTQPELAETARLSQSSISQIEKGVFIPRDSTIVVLALALKMPPEELLGTETNQITKKEKKAS
ncbi:MAG: helix-turn-helix transcriptional regulator [Oscillospiraceae bacterium]|nr:helix-turn-helix transcriptional regulator [Oscillospiraceae bacterium]